MNRTVSVNISGVFFHIDEDAYHKLEAYLESLRAHFRGKEGEEEILQDIESRIAEIFQAKLGNAKQLIIMEDVDEVISILGMPGDISGEGMENGKQQEQRQGGFRKRLFRDDESRVLGGVCAGLGHYFDIDPVWIRLAFVITLFLGGASILLYIALWIVIPRAISPAERLEMKGEAYTIDDIQRNIREEMNDLRSRFRDIRRSKEFRSGKREFRRKMAGLREELRTGSSTSRSAGERAGTFLGALGDIIYYAAKAALILLGIFLTILGVALLIAIVLSLTGFAGFSWNEAAGWESISLPAFFSMIFTSAAQTRLAMLSLSILLGVPVLMMIFNGIRLVFGFRGKIRLLSYTATFLWFGGLILALFVFVPLVSDFRKKETVSNEERFSIENGRVLEVRASALAFDAGSQIALGDWYLHADHLSTQPVLFIGKSTDTNYILITEKRAAGANSMEARSRASALHYTVLRSDSVINLDRELILGGGQPWRCQRAKVLLLIPAGAVIKFDASLMAVEDEGAWDHDMVGRSFRMDVTGKLVQ